MICSTGSTIDAIIKNGNNYSFSYSIVFDKHINYYEEIKDSFNTLNDGMLSHWTITETEKDLIINIFHDTSLATKEADLFFIFLTSLYYDCEIMAKVGEKNPYTMRLIDGKIKSFNSNLL